MYCLRLLTLAEKERILVVPNSDIHGGQRLATNTLGDDTYRTVRLRSIHVPKLDVEFFVPIEEATVSSLVVVYVVVTEAIMSTD